MENPFVDASPILYVVKLGEFKRKQANVRDVGSTEYEGRASLTTRKAEGCYNGGEGRSALSWNVLDSLISKAVMEASTIYSLTCICISLLIWLV